MVPARTPERPDGHECRGKCGGRLRGLCGEANPDCDDPMQRVCHDCLVAINKRSSKGKSKAVKPQVGKSKASGTGGVDDTTGRGGGAPPSLLRGTFVALRFSTERAQRRRAAMNGDASFYLQKATMSFIKAHASKPVQQADMRQSLSLNKAKGGGTAEDCSAVQY